MSITMTESEAPTVWRTSDMALVAYLTTLGKKHVYMEIETATLPASCFWVFEETDDIPDLVFNYLEGKGTVEPKGFNNVMAQLKNGMFDFLRAEGHLAPRR